MRKFIAIICLFLTVGACFAEKVLLPKGTVVTLKTLQDTDSKKGRTPQTAIAGDVYDESGTHILICKNTAADIQLNTRRGSVWGDVGIIVITPISTTAFNGRLIAFENEYIVFQGNDSYVSRKMQVKITQGTTFRAVIANDYYFNIE